MAKIFIVSDTHFGHRATFEKFKRDDGSPLRPYTSLKEMHDTLIENWIKTVSEVDLVLHLGDVAFSGRDYDEIMPVLTGTKYLVRGNHDRFTDTRYRRHFKRVLKCFVRDSFIFTHIPMPSHQGCRWKGNIHGHIHANVLADPFYFNASVENINFTPIDFERVKLEHYGM